MILVAEQVRLFVMLSVGLLLIGVLFRGKSAAIRNQAYRGLVFVTGIMPVIGIGFATLPGIPVATVSPATVWNLPEWTPPSVMPRQASAIRKSRADYRAESRRDDWAVGLLTTLQIGGILVFGIPAVRAWRRLRRIERAAVPLESFEGITVFRATDATLRVPVTYGVRILLPQESADWSEERVSAALLHEAAHVRRKDWSWQQCAGLFRLIAWFNPAVHLLACALRDTAEEAADDEVLERMRSSDYARELLAVAARLGGREAAGIAMVGRKGVAARIRSILDAGRDRRPLTLRWTVATGLFVGVLSLSFGAATTRMRRVTMAEPPGTIVAPSYGPVVLPDATTLELVGVQRCGYDRVDSWSRQGFPADGLEDYGAVNLGEGWSPQLVFRLLETASHDRAAPMVVRLPETFQNVTALGSNGKRDVHLMALTPVQDGLFTTSLLVGVAVGPWQTEIRPIPREAAHPAWPEEGSRESTAIEVPDFPYRRDPWSLYFEVYAQTDRRKKVETSGFEGGHPARLVFRLDPGERVLRVVFRHSPYQWVAFRDVALVPGAEARRRGGRPILRPISLKDRTGRVTSVIHKVVGVTR